MNELRNIADIRPRHQGRQWHEDGSIAGPDHCDACALLLYVDQLRDKLDVLRENQQDRLNRLSEATR